MAPDNRTPTRRVPTAYCRRETPNRTTSDDSMGSDDMSRKLRGLRGKGSSQGGSAVFTPNRPMQDRDDKTMSSRSVKSSGSHDSIGDDSFDESFACDSYALPCNLKAGVSSSTYGSVPESPRSRNSLRGLGRRGATTSRGMIPQFPSTSTSLSGASDHSSTSLSSTGSRFSTASNSVSGDSLGLHRSGTRGRSRGLGNKKISTFRITEPGSAPMVSSLGTVAPKSSSLLGSSSHHTTNSSSPSTNGQRGASRLDQRGFAAIPRPGLPDADHSSSVAPCSVAASCESTVNALLGNSNNDSTSSQPSNSNAARGSGNRRQVSESHQSSRPAAVSTTTVTPVASSIPTAAVAPVAVPTPAPASAIATPARTIPSASPARTTPADAVAQTPSSAGTSPSGSPPSYAPAPAPARTAPAASSARASRNVVPDIVREAQELSEKNYEPTEQDWANLYKKHVEVLERKDLEIAMKMSTKGQAGVYDNRNVSQEEDNGISLALQASRNELQPVDEDKMLQMVLEMSRNQETEGNPTIVNNANSEADRDEDSELPSQAALTEEEEFERVLRLSKEEAQQQAQQPLSEEEELERVLKLSQIQHEQEQQQPTNEDEELLRILQMSQKEAADLQKERETMELVLRLSQQGADGIW